MEMVLNFAPLSEAISFTENIINKNINNDYYEKCKIKLLKSKREHLLLF